MKNFYMNVGDLLKKLNGMNIPDDVPVVYQRIEDRYFEGNDISGMSGSEASGAINGVFPPGTKSKGWDTIKIKGDLYYQMVRYNEQMDRGKLVIEGKLDPDEVGRYYWHDDFKNNREYYDLEDENLLEEYVEVFDCFYDEEKNVLCLTAHY